MLTAARAGDSLAFASLFLKRTVFVFQHDLTMVLAMQGLDGVFYS